MTHTPMTYTSEFDTDVFISYTHKDNEPHVGSTNGWIDDFQDEFEKRLRTILGDDVRVFRDRKLRGNDMFADELPAKLRRTAILVSIVSPGYTKSEWCLKELKAFCEAAQAGWGLRLGNRSRIFKIIKLRFRAEREPPEIKPLLGYQFYEVDPHTQTPREIDPVLGEQARSLFVTKVNDVAYHVVDLIESFRSGATPISAGTVYLAETTQDLEARRNEIRRELEQHNYRVLPDQELYWNEPDCMQVVRSQLAQAQLSVHLVGARFGLVPEGDRPEGEMRSIQSWQYRLAMERGGAACARLVWMPPDLESNDERQRGFIEFLRTDPRAQDGADLLTDFGELKTVIRRTMEARRPAPPSGGGRDDGHRRVYLICDQQDRPVVSPITNYLYEKGLDVKLPPSDDDDEKVERKNYEAMVRQVHTDYLVSCHGVIIFCGATGKLWLEQQLCELDKARGYGRTLPMQATIILGRPEKTWKLEYRNHDPPVIKGLPEFDPRSLDQFVANCMGRNPTER